MAKAQMEIPGTERKVIKAIDDAAEDLRKVRGKRMLLTEEEGKLATKLKELLEKKRDQVLRLRVRGGR